jgi:hypothetical protein
MGIPVGTVDTSATNREVTPIQLSYNSDLAANMIGNAVRSSTATLILTDNSVCTNAGFQNADPQERQIAM